MKREVINCDYCEKECSMKHYTLFEVTDGNVKNRNDFCPECLQKMLDGLEGEQHAND